MSLEHLLTFFFLQNFVTGQNITTYCLPIGCFIGLGSWVYDCGLLCIHWPNFGVLLFDKFIID